MKKNILILCISLLYLAPAKAQLSGADSLYNKTTFGIRAGINFPSLKYSNADLDAYKSSVLTRFMLGFTLETEIKHGLSFRPEMLLIGKGQKIDDHGVSYQMKANYFELRFPFLYTPKYYRSISPYALLGPTLSFAKGGKITLDTWKADVSKASIAPLDFGLMAGLGAKVPVKIGGFPFVTSAEFTYSYGLTNTFSKEETNKTAVALNATQYTIDGTRRNRGIGTTVSLTLPLRNLSSLFVRKKKPLTDNTPTTDSIIINKKADPEPLPLPEKSCYTIEEMIAFLKKGDDVMDKKICLYDLNFETGKSIIDKQSTSYLNQLISLLDNFPNIKMKINGHTDNVGSEEYNIQLSKDRAFAVYTYLTSKGIQPNRLSYTYYGTRYPIVSNDTEEGRAKNRRVEFEIENGEIKSVPSH